MQPLFRLLLLACYVGVMVSAAVHVAVLTFGITLPFAFVLVLHVGLMIPGAIAVVKVGNIKKRWYPKGLRTVFWAATPPWLRLLSWSTFAYFVVVFIRFAATSGGLQVQNGDMPPQVLTMFSAGWLTGYAVTASYLHFVIHEGEARGSDAGQGASPN